jgi:hypothetical protein
VGGGNVLKPALRLMTSYRLAIQEIKDSQAITSYTRRVDAVQLKGADEKEVRKLHFRHNSDLRNTLMPNVFLLPAIFSA